MEKLFLSSVKPFFASAHASSFLLQISVVLSRYLVMALLFTFWYLFDRVSLYPGNFDSIFLSMAIAIFNNFNLALEVKLSNVFPLIGLS